MKELVIFDIDRTIYDGSIFLDVSLELINKNIISPKFLSKIGFEYFTYQTGFESYDELVLDCLEAFHFEVKEIDLNVLMSVVKETIYKNHHKFRPFVFECVKNKDFDYLIISLEPDFITQEVAKFLRIPNFLSNIFVENGKILREIKVKTDKKRMLEESPFQDQFINMAFGDSESDFEILRYSKKRFVLNPTIKLSNLIQNREGYKIATSEEIILDLKTN